MSEPPKNHDHSQLRRIIAFRKDDHDRTVTRVQRCAHMVTRRYKKAGSEILLAPYQPLDGHKASPTTSISNELELRGSHKRRNRQSFKNWIHSCCKKGDLAESNRQSAEEK